MVIRMRATKSHTRNRRSHHRAPVVTVTQNDDTGTTHQRHRVCMQTGMYRGKQVLNVSKKVEKKHAKATAAQQPEAEAKES